jgi:exonuclease SbcC
MRLHHLRMTAFGPFPGSERVDFDELSDAGLFLLTGPTGAGKTTVLDAVCFALYGSVPGVRGVKTLKSQHAGTETRPEVELEFSVRDRRFLVRRTPEWTRPKRRGEGFTTENASATLTERTSGEDHLLSSRAQEVGHFIGELIGMQATQFVQVAMLPQGEFQKFLRASSQERHDVLQHLFRTDRYARIEEWVHDHSRGLKERSTARQQAVVRVLDTVAERAGIGEVPEDLRADALGSGESHGRAGSWVDALIESADAARVAAADQHAAAAAAAARACAAHADAVRAHELRQRRDQALATLAVLAGEAEHREEARAALDSETRCLRCLPILRMLDEAVDRRLTLSRAWSAAASDLAATDTVGLTLAEPFTADALTDLVQQARSRASRLEALLPRERGLVEAREAVSTTEGELSALHAAQASTAERAAGIPAALEAARARASAAGAVAARAEALSLELEQAHRRLDAAEAAGRCAEGIASLEDVERDARDRAADARDRVHDLTARRLAGIAAELAGRLEDGRACQVCGSTDHPAPATASTTAVTDGEQAEASAAYDDAAAAHAAATGAVLQARERLEGLRAASGGHGPETAAADVSRLTAALREATQARTDLEEAESELRQVAAEQDELAIGSHDLALRAATLSQALESQRATVAALTAELEPELAAHRPLADQVAGLRELAASSSVAREARRDLDTATARVGELEAHLQKAAHENGFAGAEELRAAALAPDERRRLEELLETAAQSAARADAVLEDESVAALDDADPPDIDALAATVSQLDAAQASAARSLHQHEERVSALQRLRRRLEEALTAWGPVLTDSLRAEAMSRLVRGMGGDNRLQMRLSAYVLATRLDQVVAAANERLAHMRDQRYLLQRTDKAARKGVQAGLGLDVVDQWTGDVRDPATLSGGETFVVSLALALGLADVVTHEAGGTEIETLFVDEGFGTLDADTLDDVMDRLDDLRAGGRAVGVVSHVSELRNRIPTQLHVEKRRTGSALAVRTSVG